MANQTGKKVVSLSLLALSIGQAFATEEVNESQPTNKQKTDENMVVTATRYSQDTDKIPGSVHVISEKELEQQTAVSDDLTSVIANLVPGMTPSRQKLSTQGENLRGRTALIMVDGVPQNNPLRNGNRNGYTVDSSMLERVEVVQGASAVQGNGATGGIINYVTKSAKPGDHWKQTVGTRVTSNLKEDGTVGKVYYNLSQYDEDYDLFIGGTWEQQGLYYDGNGNPIGMNSIQGETQDSNATNFLAKGGYNFDGGNQRVSFSASRYQLKGNQNYVSVPGDWQNGVPGTVVPGTPSGDPTSNYAELYNFGYDHYDFFGGELKFQAFYQDFEAVFGEASWWPTANKQYDQGAIVSTKKGFKLSYVKTDLLGWDDSWVVGLDGLEDTTKQTLTQSGKDVTPDMMYQSLAPFIQGDMLVTDSLRLSGGVRFENTKVTVADGQTLWGYGNAGHRQVDIIGGEQNFSQAVFNAGAVYDFTPSISSFVGFSQGFGLPDIGRVLRGNWIGGPTVVAPVGGAPIDFNTMPAVKPVITDNYEVGLSYSDDKWFVSGSTYMSIAKDGANLSLNSGGTYDVVRQRTDIKGYEFTATYNILPTTQIQALYAHVEGQVDTNQDGSVDSDMDLKNLSPDRLLMAVNHSFSDRWNGRLQYNHMFSRSKEKNDAGSAQQFDGYGLMDVSMFYDMQRYGRISVGIENLLNEQYINYFSQIRHHNAYYFSGRGRTFSLGYEIDF
ncbi:TonB-dependent receptor [Vibrio barjaei]|uniref:TonB-dependent receptor n=1 Tax=Vibrio barjaei TaxID=1676683 RepID=UPI0007BBE882|nr:TonB-dependent receptor [Vibrio barjaei]OIN28947.1 TonB-dependent receptor [Vibrio barjaei]